LNAKSFGTRLVFCGAWILSHLVPFFTCDILEWTNEQTLFQHFQTHFQMHVHQNNVIAQISIIYIFQYEPPSTSLQTMETKHCKIPFKIHYEILKKIQKIKNFHIGPKHNEMGTYIKIRLWYKYDSSTSFSLNLPQPHCKQCKQSIAKCSLKYVTKYWKAQFRKWKTCT
jgi:hypothetical protein